MLGATAWTFDVAPIVAAIGTIIVGVFAAKIRKEQKPNGGATLRDAIDRIEARTVDTTTAIASIEATQVKHGEAIAFITGRLQGHADTSKPTDTKETP